MKHLVQSFQEHIGLRGVHFYDAESCNFLNWSDVYKFVAALPKKEKSDSFASRLEETLANYNPDTEFLAVQQNGNSVSVELYSQAQ
jgi:hypothetical protein